MTQSNLEALRGVYERWGEGDLTASIDVLAPDAMLVMRPEFPDTGTYEGIEGFREYTRSFLEPWIRITIAAEEMTDLGDHVLVAVYQRGTGKGSGAATEFRYFHLWTFRDGMAVRLETFRDREQALASLSA